MYNVWLLGTGKRALLGTFATRNQARAALLSAYGTGWHLAGLCIRR